MSNEIHDDLNRWEQRKAEQRLQGMLCCWYGLPAENDQIDRMNAAGVRLEDRIWKYQQKLTEENISAFDRRILSMVAGVDHLVGPL